MTPTFRDRTSNAFRSHQKRAKKAFATLAYTLADLREWWRRYVGEDLPGQCAYCRTFLTDSDTYCDHVIPIDRGGGIFPMADLFSLANLAVCCQRCNQIKGRMTGEEYRLFLALLDRIPLARPDIVSRLIAGGPARVRR